MRISAAFDAGSSPAISRRMPGQAEHTAPIFYQAADVPLGSHLRPISPLTRSKQAESHYYSRLTLFLVVNLRLPNEH